MWLWFLYLVVVSRGLCPVMGSRVWNVLEYSMFPMETVMLSLSCDLVFVLWGSLYWGNCCELSMTYV